MGIIRKTGISAAIAVMLATLASCGGGGGGSGSNSGGGPGDGTGGDGGTGGAVYTAPKASHAYITQRGRGKLEGSVLKCKVNNDSEAKGALTECVDSGAGKLGGPISLTLAGTSAYVINKEVYSIAYSDHWADANYTHSIWKCSLNNVDGSLSACMDTGEKEVVHIDDFFIYGDYGFMLQKYGDMILRTWMDENGIEHLENTIQNIGLKEPVNYAVDQSHNRVYIANSSLDGSSITLCKLDTTARTLTECGDANASAFQFDPPGDYNGLQPTGIALNGSAAYIVSQTDKSVISCAIGSDGRFTSCTPNPLAGVSVDILNRIAIQDKYAYITNTSKTASSGSVIKCEIAANGTLKDCAVTGPAFDSGTMEPSNPPAYTAIDSNGSDIKFLFISDQQ